MNDDKNSHADKIVGSTDGLCGTCENTDTEIWRKKAGDFYSPTILVTKQGSIGIDVAGHVIVMPVEKWHALGRLAITNMDQLTARNMETDKTAPPIGRLKELLGLFPKHNCGLHLNHNDHKNVYEKAEQWIVDNDWCDWENEEAKQRAIDTDEIWTLQWYPDTPVGFCALAAPTFEELLKLANKP